MKDKVLFGVCVGTLVLWAVSIGESIVDRFHERKNERLALERRIARLEDACWRNHDDIFTNKIKIQSLRNKIKVLEEDARKNK